MTRFSNRPFTPCIFMALAAMAMSHNVPASSDVDRTSLPTHRLTLATPLGRDVLHLEGFDGREAISELFSFRLDLIAEDDRDIPFEALLGNEMRFTISSLGGGVRHFSGICVSLTQGPTGSVSRYRAEIVPRAWLLTRRSGSRIFQDLSVPEILTRVLDGVPGLSYELRLVGEPPRRDYAVQYRESDFDFVSRLMQEEGIYYFFEHSPTGHTMVLANSPEGHPDRPDPLTYRPGAVNLAPAGSIFRLEKTQELRSGKVTLRDYSFQVPDDDLEVTAAIQPTVEVGDVLHRLAIPGSESLELYDYPGEYAQRFDGIDPEGEEQPEELLRIPAEALRTAEIRMQAEAARALTMRGASADARLVAGHKFTLTEHRDADGVYIVTSVRHSVKSRPGTSGVDYRNTFTSIPEALPFRPARTTPKPVVAGPQTAVVVGPAGEEIHTDKYGRVKVQFHWDREGTGDGDSSCWIRVAALNAGTEQGLDFIPRVGWEVVVAFLEGDPDRPIITGSVYNTEHLPPSVNDPR